jgi:hypothetical protein
VGTSISTDSGDRYGGVRGILDVLGPRTRVLALLLIIVDSIFGAAIFSTRAATNLSDNAFSVAIVVLGVVLVMSVVAITIIELTVERNDRKGPLQPSKGTPSTEILDALVNSTLEAICRAASLPLAPDHARMRAFIFQVEGNELVCKYYWALNPTSEKVNVTKFPLTADAAEEVAVVRCALERKITRTPVSPLGGDLDRTAAESVERDLTFVLAAPILGPNKKVWGTVDFDTSNELGKERLLTPLADAAIFQLTQHLQVIFSLRSNTPAVKIGATRH